VKLTKPAIVAYAETGWGLLLPKPISDLQGRRAIVLTGISGLDRLALSRFLRSKSIEFTIAPNAAELVSALRDGRADFGVTEMLLAEHIAAREGFNAEWAPEELPRFPIVFGLWKGTT
jgi:polar amino acid transport system substrate-binding protein/cystine transport system substrate-binding protein/membrane-bound lytic murein transglycosylase F